MKQKFLRNQLVEGGIKRYSQKYNVGRDIKNIGRKSLIPGLVLIGCFGLAALLGTPDQEPVERARVYQGTIAQQPAYQESLDIDYDEK